MDVYRYQALRTLTGVRFDIIQNLTREKQRFANYLFLKCSGIAQARDIQNTSATIALMERFETVNDTVNQAMAVSIAFMRALKEQVKVPFSSQASVAKFAGLVWTQHQSGDFEAEHTHLIKSGNRYLRYYLPEAANSVRRCDPEFRRYYDLKFHEVNKYQHKRALALTARKLVRLVFRLLKDNRLYIPPEG